MILSVYRTLTELGGPLIRLYLERRKARGKEDDQRFPERLGEASATRPPGGLVWLHAASVGESLSILPLVGRILERPDLSVLVTTGTLTSARLMTERLPRRALHQFVPVDRPSWVGRFLDHWRPDLALWVESEFWPNMVAATHARKVPLVLINGRMSARSFAGWGRAPGFIRDLLSRFDLCLAQTEGDAARFRSLGAPRVAVRGNLKMAVPPLPVSEAEAAHLSAILGSRPLWLAASTHPGEEALAGRVHKTVSAAHPGLLTIIVPRHPHRGVEAAAQLRSQGLTVALRSANEAPTGDIYMADTMGELGLFYHLSPITFVGKSLIAQGGQNPVEPALMGSAVLFGPHMGNFPDMAPSMLQTGAARQVEDEADLALAIGQLLVEPARLAEHRNAAREWANAQAGALDAVEAELAPYLDRAEAKHARP